MTFTFTMNVRHSSHNIFTGFLFNDYLQIIIWTCICLFREVFKARDRSTKQVVAMKKVLMENEKEGVRIVVVETVMYLSLLYMMTRT